MTGYQLAKLVNDELARHELKAIPPQMVYNYVRKGYIVAEHGDIDADEAARFVAEYVAKRVAKAKA